MIVNRPTFLGGLIGAAGSPTGAGALVGSTAGATAAGATSAALCTLVEICTWGGASMWEVIDGVLDPSAGNGRGVHVVGGAAADVMGVR